MLGEVETKPVIFQGYARASQVLKQVIPVLAIDSLFQGAKRFEE
jgi:hypothetical protein